MPETRTAWDVIEERLEGRGIRWLARQLSELNDTSLETERRTIYKWREGRQPSPQNAADLAAVLGGVADDYRPIRAGRRSRVAELEAELETLRRRLAEAEAALARYERAAP